MYDPGFDTATAAARTGASVRQLNHWDGCGIVSPSILPAAGSGSRRRYALDDLRMLTLVRELRRCGVPLDAVRSIAGRLRARGLPGAATSDLLLVCSGDQVRYLGADAGELAAACRSAPSVVVVNLGQLSWPADPPKDETTGPLTREIEVAETRLQAIVTTDGKVVTAHCRAYPECTVQADQVEAALAALTERIRAWTAPRDAVRAPAEDRRPTSKKRPAVGSDGAAAWGASW